MFTQAKQMFNPLKKQGRKCGKTGRCMPRLTGHAATWKCGLSVARAFMFSSRSQALRNVETQFKNYGAKQKYMKICGLQSHPDIKQKMEEVGL